MVASPAWYSRATLVSAAVARPRDRLRQLFRIQSQQVARRDCRREHRTEAAVEAAAAKPRDRFADAPGRFITEHHRRQHRRAIGTVAFRERQRGRGQWRAAMHDVAQVAVIGGRGIARHGIRLRCIGNRKFGAGVEPQRRLRPAAVVAGQIADDAGGLQANAAGRAGDGAGDQHRGEVERLRRQIGRGCCGQKRGQLASDGHGALVPSRPGCHFAKQPSRETVTASQVKQSAAPSSAASCRRLRRFARSDSMRCGAGRKRDRRRPRAT